MRISWGTKCTRPLLFIVVFLFPLQLSAMNWHQCMDTTETAGVITPFLYISAQVTTSSGQFTSSWGPCSLFGKTDEQIKKIFVAKNFENLKTEISLGRGEFLNEYARLNRISKENYNKLFMNFQSKYINIFGKNGNHLPSVAYDQLEKICSHYMPKDPLLINVSQQ